MAYYDRSIERLQQLIDGLDGEASLLHRTNTIQTTKFAGLVRQGKALLVEARDEMIISNYNRERDIEERRRRNEAAR